MNLVIRIKLIVSILHRMLIGFSLADDDQNYQTREMEIVKVTYKVGQKFFPSPHYDEFIASLRLSSDRRTLIVETTENRKFIVCLTNEIKLKRSRIDIAKVLSGTSDLCDRNPCT